MTHPGAAVAGRNRPKRRSASLALLWKEWRQQRWVFLPLALGMPLILLGFTVVSDFVTQAVTALFLIATAVVLGANAFCGEQDDQTARFLKALPVRHATTFWLKSASVMAMVTAAMLLMALVLRGLRAAGHGLSFTLDPSELLCFVMLVVVASLLPAVISVLARRTIACVIATFVVLVGATVWYGVLCTRPMRRMGWFDNAASGAGLAVTMLSMLVVILAGGRWLWCWSGSARPLRAKIRRVVLLSAVFLAVTLAPVVPRYVYVTFFAPLDYFLCSRSGSAVAGLTSVSPDGEALLFNCRCPAWRYDFRAAWVETATGQCRWLSRFHASFVQPWRGVWSPSGGKFLFVSSNRWLWPFKAPNPAGWLSPQADHGRYHAVVVDARTGGRRRIPLARTEFAKTSWVPVGWLSEDLIALWDERSMLFADLRSGAVSRCSVAADGSASRQAPAVAWPRWVSARGVFTCQRERLSELKQRGELRLLRFAPDLDHAEVLTVQIEEPAPFLSGVSKDGRWCLVASAGYRLLGTGAVKSVYLCSLETGRCDLLCAHSEAERAGLAGARFHIVGSSTRDVARFLPDNRTVLLHNENGLALFDLESRSLKTIRVPPAEMRGRSAQRLKLSPSGRRALVGVAGHRKRQDGRRVTHGWVQPAWYVVDLASGRSCPIREPLSLWQKMEWLGDERLVFRTHDREPGIWTMNADGTGKRRLLPKESVRNVR